MEHSNWSLLELIHFVAAISLLEPNAYRRAKLLTDRQNEHPSDSHHRISRSATFQRLVDSKYSDGPSSSLLAYVGILGIIWVEELCVRCFHSSGAGKTTLLKYVLTENHGKKILVIQNEFSDSEECSTTHYYYCYYYYYYHYYLL